VLDALDADGTGGACFTSTQRGDSRARYTLECVDENLATRWQRASGEASGSLFVERLVCARDACLVVGASDGSLEGQPQRGELGGFAVAEARAERRWTRLYGAAGASTRATAARLGPGGSGLVFGWSNGPIAELAPAGIYDAFLVPAP
jgi:hypothetical protein